MVVLLLKEEDLEVPASICIFAKEQVPKCDAQNDEVMKVVGSLQSVQDVLFRITGRLQETCFPMKLLYPNIGAWSSGGLKVYRDEDFETWQRMIRLDVARTNGEWIVYSPSQAAMSKDRAHSLAEAVDYHHLEPCRAFRESKRHGCSLYTAKW